MRAKLVTLIVSGFAGLALNMVYAAAAEPTAAGLWQNLDETGKPEGWFFIRERNGTYEGAIARMYLKPTEDPNAVCTRCEDDRKDQPWLGLEIIRGMKRDGLNYENGSILDPRDGKIYRALMRVSPDGQTLTVRGYLGFALFGQDQIWKRLPDTALKELDPAVRAKYLPPQAPPQRPLARPSPKG
jgi:uncharacterized protein (DUF2147 family)